jgi:transcriptional regulator with XRE-family HTH domain
MCDKEIIKEAMKVRGFTQSMLAEAAGLKRQSNVSEILRTQTIQVKTFVKLLNAMQFDVIIKDRNNGNKKTWVVDTDTIDSLPVSEDAD